MNQQYINLAKEFDWIKSQVLMADMMLDDYDEVELLYGEGKKLLERKNSLLLERKRLSLLISSICSCMRILSGRDILSLIEKDLGKTNLKQINSKKLAIWS